MHQPPSPRARFLHRTLFRSKPPSAEAALDAEPTGAPTFRAFLEAPLHAYALSSPGGLHCTRARQPPGSGSAQILRSMAPNSRRGRCAPPGARSAAHASRAGPRSYQPLPETRERPALDPRRQNQSAPQVPQVVGQDAQLQSGLVRPETMARQPSPVGGLLASSSTLSKVKCLF